jgi:hypothetical protein
MDTLTALAPFLPMGSEIIEVRRVRGARRDIGARVRGLPAGTSVVFVDPSFGSRRRDRSIARRAGVRIDRELLTIPAAGTTAFAVDDAPATIGAFWRRFVTVPSGATRSALPVAVATRTIGLAHPWRLVGAVVPGRVTVGTRQ